MSLNSFRILRFYVRNLTFRNVQRLKRKFRTLRVLKVEVELFVVINNYNQRLVCCFSNRWEKASMCQFKDIRNRYKNIIFNLWGTEPPFLANLLFGYAQSGSERTID